MTGMSDDLSISFELFPPKTDAGITRLGDTVTQLSAADPAYFSVTYGAGGTTRDTTARVVEMVAGQTGRPVAHHFTCVGASRAEIDRQAEGFWENGIRKIVALRGDLPDGETVPDDSDNPVWDRWINCRALARWTPDGVLASSVDERDVQNMSAAFYCSW